MPWIITSGIHTPIQIRTHRSANARETHRNVGTVVPQKKSPTLPHTDIVRGLFLEPHYAACTNNQADKDTAMRTIQLPALSPTLEQYPDLHVAVWPEFQLGADVPF